MKFEAELSQELIDKMQDEYGVILQVDEAEIALRDAFYQFKVGSTAPQATTQANLLQATAVMVLAAKITPTLPAPPTAPVVTPSQKK